MKLYSLIDPSYTVAGKRLYTHCDIDHERIFALSGRVKGSFLITYNDTPEVRNRAEKYGLPGRSIPMKTTHHLQKNELLITNKLDW